MYGTAEEGRAIRFAIPLKKGEIQKIQIFFRYGENKKLIYTSMGKFAHIPPIWGGYYVLRDWHCKVLATYPGQDRETKCCYYIDVEAILDENGRRLSLKEMSNYLKQHRLLQY